jgi:hypothetical protein
MMLQVVEKQNTRSFPGSCRLLPGHGALGHTHSEVCIEGLALLKDGYAPNSESDIDI